MANHETKRFLDAEAEANELIEELKRLRRETESIRDSRGAIEKALGVTTEVGSHVQALSSAVGRMMTEASAASIPELISAQRELTSAVEAQSEGMRLQNEKVLSEVSGLHQTVQAELNRQQSVIQGLESGFSERVQEVRDQIQEMKGGIENTKKGMSQNLAQLSGQFRVLRVMAIINVTGLLIGFAVIITMILGR